MTNLDVKPREFLGYTFTLVSVTAGVVLWATGTFQSKSDAKDWKDGVENRLGHLEMEMGSLHESMSKISSDVSYIRGRIEPKDH